MAHSVEYSLKKAKNMLRKGNIQDAEKAYNSILIASSEMFVLKKRWKSSAKTKIQKKHLRSIIVERGL